MKKVAKWVKWGPVSPKKGGKRGKGGKGRGKGRNYKAPPKSEQLNSGMLDPHPKQGAPVVVSGGDGDIQDVPELDDDTDGLIARVLKKIGTSE